jgi:hypothetical protein
MKKSAGSFVIVVSIIISSAAVATAETMIEAPQGGAMANLAGKGFKPVLGAMAVTAGDLVMVSPNNTATLVYDGNCRMAVDPGKVIAVPLVPPCAMALAAPVAAAPATFVITPVVVAAAVAATAGGTLVAAQAGLLEGILDLSFIGIGQAKPASP